MKKQIRIRKISWKEYFNKIQQYALDKYGINVELMEDGDIFIRDSISGSLYAKSFFFDWYIQYLDSGRYNFKDKFDVLLYYQTVRLFINMFGNYYNK